MLLLLKMAFVTALKKLFEDYETLLDNYTSLTAVSSKSKQKDSQVIVSDEENYYQSLLKGYVVPEDNLIYNNLPKTNINFVNLKPILEEIKNILDNINLATGNKPLQTTSIGFLNNKFLELQHISISKNPNYYLVKGVDAARFPQSPLADNSIQQVASQFNFLESQTNQYSNITTYYNDPTQGPKASLACLSSLILRDHQYKPPTQSQPIFTIGYNDGYLEPAVIYVGKPNMEKLRNEYLAHIKNKIWELNVLAQWTQPNPSFNKNSKILQVFCAAPSFQKYSESPPKGTFSENLTTLLVVAEYTAICQIAALLSTKRNENVNLHLTLVGQGAFNNPLYTLQKAFEAVRDTLDGCNVNVFIHAYDDDAIQKAKNALKNMEGTKINYSQMTSAEFFAPLLAPVAPETLGQNSFGCRDNNMCVELQESASVANNTFSNMLECIEARCLTQEQREYWDGVKNLIMNNNYTRPTNDTKENKIINSKNRIKIIDYLYLGKANDTGFIDNYGDFPKTFNTFCVGCGKDTESANFCSQDSILMDIGPDDFKSFEDQMSFVNWAVDAIKNINERISKKQNVSVYCQQGKDRSPAFVATYLFVMTNIPVTEASENKVYDFLESRRYEVQQYLRSDDKLSYFNGRMRNLIPIIKLRLFPTILSLYNRNFIGTQCLNYNYVMTEGLKDGRKQEHWFWWYFPKTNGTAGENDPYKVIFDNSNQQQVTALLSTCDLDNWCNVINKLAGFLDDAGNIPTGGGWNTSVLPVADQVKASYFINYFLRGDGKPTIDGNEQFASFKTALQNLARTNINLNNLKPIKIKKSIFTKSEQEGDFNWMIKQPEFSRSLFVFNDNEKQFYDFFTNKIPGNPGGGNAVIRQYQGSNPPRAIGVPTGKSSQGYQQLINITKTPIDNSMQTLLRLLQTGNYDDVIISWDSKENTLGSGIFKPSIEVKNYIVEQIEKTVASANNKL